jgi:putative hemolysin
MPEQDSLTFIKGIVEEFEVDVQTDGVRAETSTATIFFCTHHTGAVDFLAAYPVLSQVAPNLKVVVNRELLKIKPLASCFIGINPISAKKPNDDARREISDHLCSGGNILVFPAGKVGTLRKGVPTDFPWRTGIADILKQSARQAVPVFVDAKNGYFFDVGRKVLPKLNLLFLMGALNWRERKTVRVRIGSPIEVQTFANLRSDEIMEIIRKKTYSLARNTSGETYES